MKFIQKKYIIFLNIILSSQIILGLKLKLDSILSLYSNEQISDKNFNTPKILFEGWMQIASNSLNNNSYPPIPLSQGRSHLNLIRKNFRNFRKNPYFKSKTPGSPPTEDSFYFRLIDKMIYYTQTQFDMIIMGSLNIKKTMELNGPCVKIYSNNKHSPWILCSQNTTQKTKFWCALLQSQGKPCPQFVSNQTGNQNSQLSKIIEVEKIIQNQPIWLYSTPSPVCNEVWNYKLHGSDWKCLCSDGLRQSPIKIQRKYEKMRLLSIPATFDFPTITTKSLSIELSPNVLKIKCDEQNFLNCNELIMASIIDYDGTEYIGYEMQFHFPNEHHIDDEKYDMEIQILYKAVSEGDCRKKAGLSILIKEMPGAKNLFLQKLNVLNLPIHLNQKTNLAEVNDLKELSLETIFKSTVEEILHQKAFNYFSYDGSLTNPPCDESVKWFIVDTPIMMGLADLETIKKSVIISMEEQNKENKDVLEDIEGWRDSFQINKLNGNFRAPQNIKDRWIEYYNRGNVTNINVVL